MSNLNQDSYNKIAHEWDAIRGKTFVSKLITDFADKITPNGKILDVGCGTGNPVISNLSKQKFEIIGIDAASEMIEIAKSYRYSNTKLFNVDFFEYDSGEQFDGILAWDSFFHFPKEKQESIYIKVAKLLKTGGYLLFTHGNADGEHIDQMMGNSFYYSALPLARLKEIFLKNGLQILSIHEKFKEKNTDRDLVILAQKIE